jgi:hypothetical protein
MEASRNLHKGFWSSCKLSVMVTGASAAVFLS